MRARVAIWTLAGLCAALGLAPAPASGTIPTGNLVRNPGAEQGPGSTSYSQNVPPPGWVAAGTPTALQYGISQGLTTADSARINGGKNYFAGGCCADFSNLSQTIDVSRAAPEIDAAGVVARLSAHLGGWNGQRDYADAFVDPLDAGGAQIGPRQVLRGPDPRLRGFETDLKPRTGSFRVPVRTRLLRVSLEAVREEGDYNDGYADNIGLELSASTPGVSVLPRARSYGKPVVAPAPPPGGSAVLTGPRLARGQREVSLTLWIAGDPARLLALVAAERKRRQRRELELCYIPFVRQLPVRGRADVERRFSEAVPELAACLATLRDAGAASAGGARAAARSSCRLRVVPLRLSRRAGTVSYRVLRRTRRSPKPRLRVSCRRGRGGRVTMRIRTRSRRTSLRSVVGSRLRVGLYRSRAARGHGNLHAVFRRP